MRLIIAYNSISNILQEATTYIDLRRFIQNNFSDLPKKWIVEYQDDQGDMITLASQIDFENMLDANLVKQLNVNIIEGQFSSEYLMQKKDQYQSFKIEKIEKSVDQAQPVKKAEQNQEESINSYKQLHDRKSHWKQKMKQRVTQLIDQRIQSLLPCLTKQIQERLRDKESSKNDKKCQSDVTHQVTCKGCKISPIIGIRYKCNECVNFNFCETCQRQIQHHHNMVKMKYKEEIKAKKEQIKPFCFKENWDCGYFRGFRQQNQINQNQKNRNCHDKSHSYKDPRLKLTKKCFKMAQRLGGQPQIYEQFVKQRLDKKVNQIEKEWAISKNLVKKVDEQKIERKTKKLGFHYKKDPILFKELVSNNFQCNLEQLIKIIEKQNQIENKVQEKKVQPINQIKIEQELNKIQFKPVKIEQQSIKKAGVILDLKDLFGPQDTFKYLKFYEQNSHLTKQEIIEKYLSLQQQQKK